MKTVSCHYSNYLLEYVECYCDTKVACFMTQFCEQSQKINFADFYPPCTSTLVKIATV